MSVHGPDVPLVNPGPVATSTAGPGPQRLSNKQRVRRLTGRDRVVVILMVLVPMILVIGLVWIPALSTVALSFTNWDGIGGLSTIKWIGTKNYQDIVTIYPPFKPAIQHNLLFLAVLFLIATPMGIFLATLLDKEIRGSRIYQTPLFMPVVLSLALIGFIWQLQYSRDFGLINAVLQAVGLQDEASPIDWYGDPSVNIWAVLVASSWRHVGYIMLLYLAGLKGVDPSLREAAAMDGAGEVKTFFRIVFPVLRPINIIVVAITVIEALRAFDLVWVINKGRNGLELIGALVSANVVGEASRIGFGSALATIMLVVAIIFVAFYIPAVMREEQR
jgi:multiple sugar transport system permease protein